MKVSESIKPKESANSPWIWSITIELWGQSADIFKWLKFVKLIVIFAISFNRQDVLCLLYDYDNNYIILISLENWIET
jgi:hypothetical protein